MNVMTVGIVVSTNRIDDILSPWTEILNKRGFEYNMNVLWTLIYWEFENWIYYYTSTVWWVLLMFLFRFKYYALSLSITDAAKTKILGWVFE